MKIVGICGSTRKNATEYVLKEALKATETIEGIETEFITVRGKKINPCIHCDRCVKEEYTGCLVYKEDDMDEILPLRAAALNKEDKSKKIRKSHKNPSALKIYKEFIGEPGGKLAHKLLHTKYTKTEHL
jgi:ferredoxin